MRWDVLLAIFSIKLVADCNGITIDEIIANAEEKYRQDFPGLPQNSADEDGNYIVNIEHDMLFTKQKYQQMERELRESSDRRKKRKATRDTEAIWPGNIVPYRISNLFTPDQVSEVMASFGEWERYTCIRFRQWTPADQNWLVFQDGAGCQSFVGRQKNGGQQIYLHTKCRKKSVIVHEIGHAIGFYHEQSRPDRDDYVTVNYTNIIPGRQRNFEKWKEIKTLDIPYDYKSIMHYGQKAFSMNGKPTLVTVDPDMQDVIGTSQGLSFRDIQLANLLYSCNKLCTNPPSCPPNSFIGQDCKCWCETSPSANICPGFWSAWSSWSVCSQTCSGTRSRSRSCPSGTACAGLDAMTVSCSSSICSGRCGGILTTSSGVITSPGYPDDYSYNLRCSWTIQAPHGSIKLTFTDFNLEHCEHCNCDYLSVYDGISATASLLAKVCGSSTPEPIKSRGNAMFILFNSDISVGMEGFRATYQVSAPSSFWGRWSQYGPCSVTCGLGTRERSRSCNPDGSGQCKGRRKQTESCQEPTCPMWTPWNQYSACSVTCGMGTRKRSRTCRASNDICTGAKDQIEPCQAVPCECGDTNLRALSGVITSPNYPEDYSASLNCTWIIKLQADRILLNFTDFHLEPCKNCQCDSLSVHAGTSIASPQLIKVCDSQLPASVQSTGTAMLVRFISDSSVHFRGFRATFKQIAAEDVGLPVCGNTILTAPSGMVTSPGHPRDYPNDIRCTWNIQVPSGPIQLTFTKFHLEQCTDCDCDSLSIYDGASSSAPEIIKLCGSEVPSVVRSTGNAMTIVFVSDISVPMGGFSATYQSHQTQTRETLLSCDFETECAALVQLTDSDDYDWQRTVCCTPSTDTGPDNDHTKGNKQGHFMFTEASPGIKNNNAMLQTEPALHHDGSQVCLKFWYHMYGKGMGSLQVLLLQTGQPEVQIWRRSGNQGNRWTDATVDVKVPANTDYRIQFRGIYGSNYTGDISIDDVLVTTGECSDATPGRNK